MMRTVRTSQVMSVIILMRPMMTRMNTSSKKKMMKQMSKWAKVMRMKMMMHHRMLLKLIECLRETTISQATPTWCLTERSTKENCQKNSTRIVQINLCITF
jgi:hypothetical protein